MLHINFPYKGQFFLKVVHFICRLV